MSRVRLRTAADLDRLATEGQHVVLHFPTPVDKKAIIEHLAPQLPQHHVFDSGGKNIKGQPSEEWVTVKRLMEERVILENAPLFVDAVHDFWRTAQQLTARLARHLSLPGEQISERWRLQLPDVLTNGDLDAEWWYAFHGYECLLRNKTTGQRVDVRLKDWGELENILDPYFFADFVCTSPAHQAAARLIREKYWDGWQILNVLSRKYLLR